MDALLIKAERLGFLDPPSDHYLGVDPGLDVDEDFERGIFASEDETVDADYEEEEKDERDGEEENDWDDFDEDELDEAEGEVEDEDELDPGEDDLDDEPSDPLEVEDIP